MHPEAPKKKVLFLLMNILLLHTFLPDINPPHHTSPHFTTLHHTTPLPNKHNPHI